MQLTKDIKETILEALKSELAEAVGSLEEETNNTTAWIAKLENARAYVEKLEVE